MYVPLARAESPNGGITYVDVAYSLRSHFSFFAMQNAAGRFTLPGLRGIAGAAHTGPTTCVSSSAPMAQVPAKVRQVAAVVSMTGAPTAAPGAGGCGCSAQHDGRS